MKLRKTVRFLPQACWPPGVWYKDGREVVEKLFKVNQPNISLSVPVNRFLSL